MGHLCFHFFWDAVSPAQRGQKLCWMKAQICMWGTYIKGCVFFGVVKGLLGWGKSREIHGHKAEEYAQMDLGLKQIYHRQSTKLKVLALLLSGRRLRGPWLWVIKSWKQEVLAKRSISQIHEPHVQRFSIHVERVLVEMDLTHGAFLILNVSRSPSAPQSMLCTSSAALPMPTAVLERCALQSRLLSYLKTVIKMKLNGLGKQ